jgi:photosystem II stability/assembly factor-like uncharacterized protein
MEFYIRPPNRTKRTMISKAARVWYFCLVGLIVLPQFSDASWQRVFYVNSRAFTAGYFFSELRGIIASVDASVFYRTSDGGKTWLPANSVPFGFPGIITQVFMTDTLRGWASVEDPVLGDHPREQVWRTTDGGINWFVAAILDTGNFSCIYETSKAITVTSRSPRFNSLKSFDGGNTFQPGGFNVTNGIDFVDDNYGVMTGFQATPWKRTTDGGLTWQTIAPQMTEESWGVYGVKGTGTFFVASEVDPTIRGARNSPVFRSTDYGTTWQNIHTFPFNTNGHVAGAFGKVYIQSDGTDAISGLFRSDDGGVTWKSIGGPTRIYDKRFIVTGCNGGVVYAFDETGGVWKTRDGGDGTVAEPNPEPVFMGLPITFSSRICATTYAKVRITNQYCDTLKILDVSFLDPNDDAVKSGAIVITNANFPASIEGGGEDSIEFRWDPSRYIHTDTTVSFQVRIRYFSKALFAIRDTVITISAQAIGDEAALALAPTLLDLQSINFCTPVDSVFNLTNNGCDTLFILGASGTTPINYELLDASANPIVYPVRIPPNASFMYRVRVTLTKAGQYISTITIRLRHQGKLKDTTIALRAVTTSDGAYNTPLILDFGKVSICAPKDSFTVIGNLACDTMFLTSAALGSAGEFSIVTNPAPANIFPDSLKRIFLRYAPTDLGFDYDTLVLSVTTLGDPITVKIIIRGEGVSGDAMLVVAPTADTLFDLSMTRCDSPEHFDIALSNPGCKQLRILEAKLEGPLTRNIALTSTAILPIDLRLGAGTGLSVEVTPLDVSSTSGLIRIRYQIEGEAARDTVLYYALRVDYGKRVLALDRDKIDFGSYGFCIEKDTTIILRNTGCDTLDLTGITFSGATDETWSYSGGLQLGPGDTASIHYHITPVSAGSRTSSFQITSVSDSTNPLLITLNSSIIPTDTVKLNIAPLRFPFYVGDTITIQVIPENGVDVSLGLRDIAFTLYYNGDLLTLIPSETRTFSPGIFYITGNASTFYPAKQVAQRFFVNGSPYISFAANEPIMEFRFHIRLTDTTNTALEIRDIALNGTNPTFSKCVLGFTSALTDLELALRCGDSLLREFMRKGNQFTLSASPVFPDPLTEENGFAATLAFEVSESRNVTLYIYDAVGKTVRAVAKEASKGINQINIDGQDLSAGSYSYILFDGFEYGRGRFVIAK